jgi:hypothetical protein
MINPVVLFLLIFGVFGGLGLMLWMATSLHAISFELSRIRAARPAPTSNRSETEELAP